LRKAHIEIRLIIIGLLLHKINELTSFQIILGKYKDYMKKTINFKTKVLFWVVSKIILFSPHSI